MCSGGDRSAAVLATPTRIAWALLDAGHEGLCADWGTGVTYTETVPDMASNICLGDACLMRRAASCRSSREGLMESVSSIDALCSADKAGALLNYEAAANLEAFRGRLDEARRLFREGSMRSRPSSRYLREWGAFEKRAGSLDVSTLPARCKAYSGTLAAL